MKKLTALVLTLLLLVSLAVPAFAYTTVLSTQNLTVDGKPINCERYNIDGSNYFKLRDLAYLLMGTPSEFGVGYDAASNSVIISPGLPYEPNGSELVIGEDKSATAVPSPQSIWCLDAPTNDLSVYNIGGNNYFKLRDLGTMLGFGVDYDEASKTMVVTSGAQIPTPAPAPSPSPAPAPAGERTELNSEQIYARCMPAVLYIEVYDEYGDAIATGSGFFIDGEGTAVTNHHVIYGATSAKVWLADSSGADQESRDVLGVYDWNEEEDWAVLKVEGSNASWLRIGDPSTAMGGATVYALGSPLGLSASISDGMVSNPARVLDGQTYIQISAPISHGSSGGALVNKYGEVVGITSAGFDEGQNLNLAVPIAKVANAAHGALTPINETYTMPGGLIYTDVDELIMRPGETVDVVVTAQKYNTDALLTVIPYFWGDDDDEPVRSSDLVTLSYESWAADSDHYTMHVTANESFGSTTLILSLETKDGDFLNYTAIYVSVLGGEVTPEVEELTLDVGASSTILIAARADDGRSVKVRHDAGDSGVISCVWGDWNEAQDHISLTVNGLACGSYYLTLSLIDAKTEAVLATNYLMVTVVGGKLTISDPEIMMAPGESKTVTIAGVPNDPSVQAFIYTDECESSIIDWQRGQLGTGTVQVTVKALAEGWDCIYVTLEDNDGNVLVDGWIDVYVNMDGRGSDELGI